LGKKGFVKNFKHNKTADWWSLGIIAFELAFGKVPFVPGD